MKEQLIFLLFAIVQWARPSEDGCTGLSNQILFDKVKLCRTLSGPREKNARAELMIKGKIDNGEWNDFTSKLTEFRSVDVLVRNSTVKKIDLPNFVGSSDSLLVVSNNKFLEEISLNIVGQVSFDGFSIFDNPKLKTIKVVVTPPGFLTFNGGELEIVGNDQLTTIQTTEHSDLSKITILLIRENRRLQDSSLAYFRVFRDKIAKNLTVDIFLQEAGECVFKGTIHDLAELKGCKYVYGNLIMDPDVIGEATGVRLTRVSGEIYLANLRPDKLDFLKNTKVRPDLIKSDSCEFKLDTVPVYENKKKCPPSVNNQEKGLYPLLYGLGIGGGILFVAALIGLLLYCLWWKKKSNKKSKESSKSSDSGKKSSSSSKRGK